MLCMVLGVLIGRYLPGIPACLSRFEYARVSIPMAVLIWLLIGLFFFVVFKAFITPELATEYLAGAVLLGAAPCTVMVFVWSTLTKGDPASPAALATTVGVLTEVPVMLFLVNVANRSRGWFDRGG